MNSNYRTPLSLSSSETVSTDALGQLEVLRHDGHSLGMDGTQVGILE